MSQLLEQIQRLSLSGLELKELNGWSDAMVEDYLRIGESLIAIAQFVEGDNTFGVTPLLNAGNGTVASDMNNTDFTGHPHAKGSAIEVKVGENMLVSHDGLVYQYFGKKNVTIGVGGTYASSNSEYVVLSATDHRRLTNRNADDQHKATAISYSNTLSQLLAVTVQRAIDELDGVIDSHIDGSAPTLKHPASDITYADTTVPPFGATNVQDALVAIDLLIKGRVRWLNLWVVGTTYYLNDMVLDGEWTMIANKTTTDRPAPQIDGTPAFYLPDAPTWTNANYLDICYTGFRFQTVKPFVIDGLRAWLPDISPDIRYTAYLVDESEPANPIILQAVELETLAVAVGWVEVSFGTTFVPAGVNMTLMLVTRRFIASPDWTWQWTSDLNSGTTPTSGNFNINGTNDIVYLNQLDNLGTNRDADIGALVLGDEVTISESATSSRYSIYRVLAVPVLTAGVWALSVLQLSAGGAIRNGRLCDVHAVPTTTVANAPYSYLPNYLTTSPPDPTLVTNVTGFIDNKYPPTVSNDNGYGIDMSFSGVTVSPDWDIVSHGTGEGVSAGAVWGQITGDVLNQTDMIAEMNKRAIAMSLALGG